MSNAEEMYEELPDDAEDAYEDPNDSFAQRAPKASGKKPSLPPPRKSDTRSTPKSKPGKPVGAVGKGFDLSAIKSGKSGLKPTNSPVTAGLPIQQNDLLDVKNKLRTSVKRTPAPQKSVSESEKIYDVNPNDFKSIFSKFENKASSNSNVQSRPGTKPKPKPPPERPPPQKRTLPPVPTKQPPAPPQEEDCDQEYDDASVLKKSVDEDVGEEYDDTSLLRSLKVSESVEEEYDDTSMLNNVRASKVSTTSTSSTGSGDAPALPPRHGPLRDSDPHEEEYEEPDIEPQMTYEEVPDPTPAPKTPARVPAHEEEAYEELPDDKPTPGRRPVPDKPAPVPAHEEEAYEELPDDKPAPGKRPIPDEQETYEEVPDDIVIQKERKPPPPLPKDDEPTEYEELPDDKGAPISPTNRPLPQTPKEPLAKMPWAFLDTTRERAETLISKEGKDGVFLVRGSKHGHKYTLTMWFNKKIWNLPVNERPGGRLALGEPKDKEVTFEKLPDLIQHYQKKNLTLLGKYGGFCTLLYPPPK